MFGQMQSVRPCSKCGGTGKVITSPCPTCNGKGETLKTVKVKVKIPAGINDGQTLPVREQGNAGKNGGPNGDLLITVSVRNHRIFTRQGYDILCDFPVTFVEAALGGEIEVPTIDEKVAYNIPEGTQSGTVFRLRGRGVPKLYGGGARGDMYVTIVVETPKGLNKEQKDLLIKFGESVGTVKYNKKKNFFDTVKDIFK